MTRQEYYNEVNKIEKNLHSHGLVCEVFSYPNDFDMIDVNVEWGDWKHSHEYCDYIMKQKGWELESESIYDEDDSDCYCSTHTYKRVK